MIFQLPLIEWIGYLGSVIVAVSLTMSSIKKLRWYNLTGAAVFSFYGFVIGAYPVALLNLFIVVTDTYYIYKMYSVHESFTSIVVDETDPYLNYFLDYYQTDIKKFFPDFDKEVLKASDKTVALLLLRNATVAGVFLATKENETLAVQLDFVTAEYRDLKPGDFIYSKNIEQIKKQGIRQITCNTGNATHQKYLSKMGFKRIAETAFAKEI